MTKRAAYEEGAKIVAANALHITGGPVSHSYEQVLAEKFTAELFERSDLATINAWVKQKTEGSIDTILEKLNPNSVCVILNAIYFKNKWAAQFDEKKTVLFDNFHLSKSETIQVPMMHHTGQYRVVHDSTFDAIELPYKGEKLMMIVLLPRQQLAELGRVAIDIGDETAKAVIDGLGRVQPNTVHLSIPKFKTEFAADLIPPFKELGMKLAFDGADFSGIEEGAREGDLWISQIQHKTFIDVNEAGTMAGASTAVELATKSMVPAVKIDHPFLYLIADTTSGAILFVGRLSDPRK